MSRKLPQIVLVTQTQGDRTSKLVFPFLSFMIFHVPLLFFPKKVTTNPITIMSYFRLAQTSFSSFSGLFGKSFPELFCPQYATRRCLPTVENEMTLIYCILICKRREHFICLFVGRYCYPLPENLSPRCFSILSISDERLILLIHIWLERAGRREW